MGAAVMVVVSGAGAEAMEGVVEAGCESGCKGGCGGAPVGVATTEDIGMMGAASNACGGGTTHALHRRCRSATTISWCGGESRRPGGRLLVPASASRITAGSEDARQLLWANNSFNQYESGLKADGPPKLWNGSSGSKGSPSRSIHWTWTECGRMS
jgi:hypothetical protein